MAKFKVGDVVRLKSGGDAMTVVEVKPYVALNKPATDTKDHDEDVFACVWFQVVGATTDGRALYADVMSHGSFESVQLVSCSAWKPKE